MNRHPRQGFTLVELLVVITLLGLLAGLTLMLMPGIMGQAREARGAQQVQGALNIARQRAVRDQAPFGVRFWYEVKDVTPTEMNVFCSEMEYLEQPNDYNGDPMFTDGAGVPVDPTNSTLYFIGGDVTNGQPGDRTLWSIQPGDFISAQNEDTVHRVLDPSVRDVNGNFENGGLPSVDIDGPLSALTGQTVVRVKLNSGLPPSMRVDRAVANRVYFVVRNPRPTGDEKLTLPPDVFIDLSTNLRFGGPLFPLNPNPLAPVRATTGARGYGDIVFGPSGAVIMPRLAQAWIPFWVRTERSNEIAVMNGPTPAARYFMGEPGLIAVWSGSGLVASYPVRQLDPTNPVWTPYSLIQ